MIKIEKINLKQVIHNIKNAYITASKDTEPVTYGNIAEKVANMGGGDSLFSATASTFKTRAESILDIIPITATTIKEEQ